MTVIIAGMAIVGMVAIAITIIVAVIITNLCAGAMPMLGSPIENRGVAVGGRVAQTCIVRYNHG